MEEQLHPGMSRVPTEVVGEARPPPAAAATAVATAVAAAPLEKQ